MKSHSALVLCTPVLGRQLNAAPSLNASKAANFSENVDDVSKAVSELNAFSQELYNLPLASLTEGVYDISIGETGPKEGYYVNMHYKWDKVNKWTIRGLVGGAVTAVPFVPVAFSYLVQVHVLRGVVEWNVATLCSWCAHDSGWSIGTALTRLYGSLFAKESLRLEKNISNQQWKLTHTSSPGTFLLENVRSVGGKPY